MTETRDTDLLEQRLRRDLRAVAATITDERPAEVPAWEPVPPRRTHRTRNRVLIGAAALAVPATLAAGALVRQGPEYVDAIPPQDVVATGSVDGSRYLLVESRRTDPCGDPVTGVELVEERENLIGSEWSTTGYQYGEPVQRPCGTVFDASRWLGDPALFESSGVEVGDSFVWVFSVHPDVDTVRVTADGRTTELVPHRVDGAGYAVYEVPREVDSWTSELVSDGRVVPGSVAEKTLVRP